MHKAIVLTFALLSSIAYAFGKDVDTLFFHQKQIELQKQYSQIALKNGKDKKIAEIAFRDSLSKTLKHEGAAFFSFDSLPKIGRINSEDKKLIIYSWNIPQPGNFNNYYGIILHYNKPIKKFEVFVLNEKPGLLNRDNQTPSSLKLWGGTLYYQIITTKYKGKVYYTLLGFDFNNLLSNRKIIDVLYFDEFSTPSFLQNRFLYEGKQQNRVVFEYAERAQMTVRYNAKRNLIIFDHLSPFKPSLQNQYQFYGPDLSFDGLIFEDGIWKHQTDITPEF